MINNPKVSTVRVTLQNGEITEEIVREIPYVFYVSSFPSEYLFLDAEGDAGLRGGDQDGYDPRVL